MEWRRGQGGGEDLEVRGEEGLSPMLRSLSTLFLACFEASGLQELLFDRSCPAAVKLLLALLEASSFIPAALPTGTPSSFLAVVDVSSSFLAVIDVSSAFLAVVDVTPSSLRVGGEAGARLGVSAADVATCEG